MLSDNVKAWQMNPDGLYSRINTEAPKVNSQAFFLSQAVFKKKYLNLK